MDFMIWKGLNKLLRMDVPQISALNPSPVKQNAGDGPSVKCGGGCHSATSCHQSSPLPPAWLGEDGILSTCLREQSQGNTHTYSREQK